LLLAVAAAVADSSAAASAELPIVAKAGPSVRFNEHIEGERMIQ
jgi:hypothetical protein